MTHISSRNYRGFTLVEIMIVVAIIALLAAMAGPNLLRSRRRAQAVQTLDDLRIIHASIDIYALEFNKMGGAAVSWSDIRSYIKTGCRLGASGGNDCIGNAFVIPSVDVTPKVPIATFNALSNVAPTSFWSPFNN